MQILPWALGFGATGVLAFFAFQSNPPKSNATIEPGSRKIGNLVVEEVSPKRDDKVVKTEAEWKMILTEEEYRILRRSGTEPAFCEGYLTNKEKGVYHCKGCDLPLFRTDSKFDSGTGWPSFFQPVKRENVWLKSDFSYGMDRIEVLCSRCDGHLGHVFPDGPRDQTGLRFCINSASLKFHKSEGKDETEGKKGEKPPI
ncbi:MAG: peptide-methionine (R)-S-oxide reductase MsrB [Fimbriimonadaceae bacterium]|jgi:methionine-R-sulfoxide reductase|nr:peptide-methionine (R)-S-oxide reductase MsrB [Fimbriimonadaceae bacterium]